MWVTQSSDLILRHSLKKKKKNQRTFHNFNIPRHQHIKVKRKKSVYLRRHGFAVKYFNDSESWKQSRASVCVSHFHHFLLSYSFLNPSVCSSLFGYECFLLTHWWTSCFFQRAGVFLLPCAFLVAMYWDFLSYAGSSQFQSSILLQWIYKMLSGQSICHLHIN